MNIYRHKFYSRCPNNGQLIEYHFELITAMVQVEDIVAGCAVHKMGYHETIADDLLQQFGGRQTLKAHHHGVDVETRRESSATLEHRCVIGPQVFEKGVSVQCVIDYLSRHE